jgi:hypothetical protein
MIISWFTQPAGFASYYQYDTSTKQFSRTRLELGRGGSDGGDTFVSYKPKRYVGFSKDTYSSSDLSKWSVEDDALCYNKTKLKSGPPESGDKVYDSTDTGEFVHRGNPVTEQPTLPDGISGKHLALLANDVFVNGQKGTFKLTEGTASPEDLAEAIKAKVCEIVGVDKFEDATDDKILEKLTSQIKEISGKAAAPSAKSLNEALDQAKQINDAITEQIENGAFTPTQDFETAFGQLQTAIGKAQSATGGADLKQALVEIGAAQQSLNTAIENIDATEHESVSKQLENARDALESAKQNVTDWQAIEEEYKPLAETDTIEDYEREIGVENEEVL